MYANTRDEIRAGDGVVNLHFFLPYGLGHHQHLYRVLGLSSAAPNSRRWHREIGLTFQMYPGDEVNERKLFVVGAPSLYRVVLGGWPGKPVKGTIICVYV